MTRVHPYSAEARITMEDPLKPILKGDHILTASWDPGYQVPFAVAGRFDLDGDPYDDLEKLVRMIERNGGKVVAKHDIEGSVVGELDPDIRYLVLGSQPEVTDEFRSNVSQTMGANGQPSGIKINSGNRPEQNASVDGSENQIENHPTGRSCWRVQKARRQYSQIV